MKNKLIILSLIGGLLISCDKRKDFFIEFNTAPTIQINSKDNLGSKYLSFTDDVLDSFKLSQSTYLLNVLATDESKESVVSSTISPSGNVAYNENPRVLKSGIEEISGKVVFNPNTIGTYYINLNIVDQFDVNSTATATVVVFDNKPPVIPSLIITHDPLLNQYEYHCDASSAFDQDENFGGGIIKYNWIVGANYSVETGFNEIQYIFPSPGTYLVRVRCMDNDSVWSPFISVSHLVTP